MSALYCSASFGQVLPKTRPAFTALRYDENYSFLRDSSLATDWLDSIKFIPLDTQRDSYLSLGGQIRDRYEYFNHNLFGTGTQDRDGFNLTRITENADFHLGDNFRVFVQGASAFEDGREGGPRPQDRDEIDLEQAFAELTMPVAQSVNLDVRAGRQFLKFGAERLLGPADYNNARRTFDGLRVDLDSSTNSLDFLLFRPVQVQPYKFDSADDKNGLVGLYDTLKLPEFIANAHSQLEAYGLYLDRQGAALPVRTGAGTENVYTLGSRFSTNPKPFDFDVEGDYQFGDFRGNDISAYSFATRDGYTFDQVELRPRPFIGFDIASGSNRKTGTIGTFNQLYPTSHGQFGNIDAIGRQNIIDLNTGIDLTLLEHEKFVQALTLRTSFYEFWRQSLNDAVYTAGGVPLRTPGTARARYIGNELDVQLNWQIDPHFSSYIGYSHFFPGTFISQTGTSRAIDYAYAAVSYTF